MKLKIEFSKGSVGVEEIAFIQSDTSGVNRFSDFTSPFSNPCFAILFLGLGCPAHAFTLFLRGLRL